MMEAMGPITATPHECAAHSDPERSGRPHDPQVAVTGLRLALVVLEVPQEGGK
jgi:hypothetical protein